MPSTFGVIFGFLPAYEEHAVSCKNNVQSFAAVGLWCFKADIPLFTVYQFFYADTEGFGKQFEHFNIGLSAVGFPA